LSMLEPLRKLGGGLDQMPKPLGDGRRHPTTVVDPGRAPVTG
jgi:hypothetical protein